MSRRSGWMIVIPAVFPCSLLRSAELPPWSECRQPAECARKRTRVMSGRTGLLKVNRAIASVLDSMARVDMVCRLRFKLGRVRWLGGWMAAIVLGRRVVVIVRAERGFDGVVVGARRVIRVKRGRLAGGPAQEQREDGWQDQQGCEGCQGHAADHGPAERRVLLASRLESQRHGDHPRDHGATRHDD